jgi:hypothetical protein
MNHPEDNDSLVAAMVVLAALLAAMVTMLGTVLVLVGTSPFA